jgi:hypothetical protein
MKILILAVIVFSILWSLNSIRASLKTGAQINEIIDRISRVGDNSFEGCSKRIELLSELAPRSNFNKHHKSVFWFKDPMVHYSDEIRELMKEP